MALSEASYDKATVYPIGMAACRRTMVSIDTQCKETGMGENKGHSDKNPSYPELDDMGSGVNRATDPQSADGQLDIGNEQSGNLQGSSQQGSSQQQGSEQQGSQQQGNQQQNGGQSQQHGGQHASGGTPALDDLNAQEGNRQSGAQSDAMQTDWSKQQDKDR